MSRSRVSVEAEADYPAQVRESIKTLAIALSLTGVMILIGLFRGEWVVCVVGIMVAVAWAGIAYITWPARRDISASAPSSR